ncbi:peptide-methionine (S)-S-oxide reductase MsrA [Pseudonocardiaceae bacterium YIM PH 21723]|nr:peptide-methionine (S)-S-oxide reductase MsrA [Pseudonocardiaceae bacterium YIM PH 21723]
MTWHPALVTRTAHAVFPERSLIPPFLDHLRTAVFGMGCFWGAERLFWNLPGVWVTAAGYAGGATRNPTYREVGSGNTGHVEAVLVVFDPAQVSYPDLLAVFWPEHDPTQGMRQGNDVGSQYRSAIYYADDQQRDQALASRATYQKALRNYGHGDITTEIKPLIDFWWAEDEHQQYLFREPAGHCGLERTGVRT